MSFPNVRTEPDRAVRESNTELLRIVLMGMIVIHHALIYGLGLPEIGQGETAIPGLPVALLINSFVIVGVNGFIFISGYYGIRLRVKSLLSLILQTVFYSAVIYIVVYLVCHKGTPEGVIKSFFPISTSVWWFVTAYIGLCILSPLLNRAAELLNRQAFGFIVAALLYLNCFSGFGFHALQTSGGYSLFSFITVYLLSRYLAIYKVRPGRPGLKYGALCLLLAGGVYALLETGHAAWAWRFFSYNNPLVIGATVMLFFAFQGIRLRNGLVNRTAMLVLGVYLIHESTGFGRPLLAKAAEVICDYNPVFFYATLPIFAAVVFALCAVMEWGRQRLCAPLVRRIVATRKLSELDMALREGEKN